MSNRDIVKAIKTNRQRRYSMTPYENYQKWLIFDLPDYLRQNLKIWTKKQRRCLYTNLELGTAGMRGFWSCCFKHRHSSTLFVQHQSLARWLVKGGNEKRGVTITPMAVLLTYLPLILLLHLFISLQPQSTQNSHCSSSSPTISRYHDYCQSQSCSFNGYKVYGEDGGQIPPHDADALTTFITINPFAVEIALMSKLKKLLVWLKLSAKLLMQNTLKLRT